MVLVPTMGAFREAHAALFRRARKLAGEKGKVIVSLFVESAPVWTQGGLRRLPSLAGAGS